MGSHGSIPWCNRPAREFPARVWMEERCGFRVLPLHFAGASQPEGRREFPAKRWLRERRHSTSASE
jgi:hypothetical protein